MFDRRPKEKDNDIEEGCVNDDRRGRKK